MKTIPLREYQSWTGRLSKDELHDLLQISRQVAIAPTGGPDEYRLTASGSSVGTIVLPHVRLLIQPKMPVQNLFFLLGFRPDLIRWAEAVFPFEEDPDLFHIVAWMFQREVGRQSARGLMRGYVARAEALTTIRGRVDMGRQLSRHQSRQLPVECTFEDFTEDISLNQLIKAACRAVLLMGLGDELLARRFRHQLPLFLEVSDIEYPPGRLPEVQFDRLNRRWEAAATLGRLILSRQSLRDDEGRVIASAFLVDMNKVFEKFVERVVIDEARATPWGVNAQASRALTQSIEYRPDLVLIRDGKDQAVGDAKYKLRTIEDWLHPDMYQLLAYCVGLGLPRGLLIYASDHARTIEHVPSAGIDLETIGIDLGASHDGILDQARRAARLLIAHAGMAEPGRDLVGPLSDVNST